MGYFQIFRYNSWTWTLIWEYIRNPRNVNIHSSSSRGSPNIDITSCSTSRSLRKPVPEKDPLFNENCCRKLQVFNVFTQNNLVYVCVRLQTNKQTNKHTYIHTDRQTERQTDKQTDVCTYVTSHTGKETDTQTNECMYAHNLLHVP